MSRSEASETLLICDGCTLAVERVPEGKMKVRSGTAVVDTTILSRRSNCTRNRQSGGRHGHRFERACKLYRF